MSNITHLEFEALEVSGKDYLSWVLDAEVHLVSKNLGKSIEAENTESPQDRAKALIFIRHHIDDALKVEYLTVKDPAILWANLKDRFDHLKAIILPTARYEWHHLRLQDFKSVEEYNSEMFRITSKLNLCGEQRTEDDMMEKTFSTFHASNLLLQQYREKGFKKYSDLITCLLVAEQNNQLLMKNHESRPTGSKAVPEAHAITFPEANLASFRGRGNGRGRGRGISRGNFHGRNGSRGRGRYRGRGRELRNERQHFHQRGNIPRKPVTSDKQYRKTSENKCYRCGMTDHWSRTCRTPPHLVNLYQESMKKGKVEVNYATFDDTMDLGDTHLDVADFLNDPVDNFGEIMGNASGMHEE